MDSEEKIKIYYDILNDEIEIVCPDGSIHWSWYDSIGGDAGFYRAKSSDITSQNNQGYVARFEFVGFI